MSGLGKINLFGLFFIWKTLSIERPSLLFLLKEIIYQAVFVFALHLFIILLSTTNSFCKVSPPPIQIISMFLSWEITFYKIQYQAYPNLVDGIKYMPISRSKPSQDFLKLSYSSAIKVASGNNSISFCTKNVKLSVE